MNNYNINKAQLELNMKTEQSAADSACTVSLENSIENNQNGSNDRVLAYYKKLCNITAGAVSNTE